MPDRPTRLTFTDFLARIDSGTFTDDLEDELQNVVGAVQESGKTGKLKLEVKVKLASEGNAKQLLVEPKIKTKEPRPTRPASIFYADDDAQLHRSDPDQKEMELKDPPSEDSGPLRKVEGAAS
jgi:hypothetical protein